MAALSEHLRVEAGIVSALRGQGCRVAVIGATGWLGSAALAMLDRAFLDEDLDRRMLVFGSKARRLALPSGRQIACRELEALTKADLGGSLVLHFAYLTRDRAGLLSADDYIALNTSIQDSVIGAIMAHRPRGVFFASSGAVYQVAGATKPAVDRDLYGWMKAAHERQFEALTDDVAVVNGRIFSVAGEFINKPDAYALGSILTALRDGGPIRLRSPREVWRSYAYVGDIINLALALLLRRQTELRLDIAGGEPVEVGHLAALCAELTGHAGVAIERPPPSGEAADSMLGDASRYHDLLASAGLSPLPLAEQVCATASFLHAFKRA